MDQLFTFHKLNLKGIMNAKLIATGYNNLLEALKRVCPESREFSIAKTKLEESCFYAKKAMANNEQNLELDQSSADNAAPSDQKEKPQGSASGGPGQENAK